MPIRLPVPTVTDLLGMTTTVLALWFSVPQLLRVARTRVVAGVSTVGLTNSAVSLTGWTLYGIAHGFWWVVAASVVGLPATVATVVLASRLGDRPRPFLPALWAAVLVVAGAIAVLAEPAVLDVVLGCSILWFVVPAALQAWRSDDVSGVSGQSWVVLAVEASLFGLYGLLADVGADRVYGVAAVAGSAVVLVRLWVLRTPGVRTTTPPTPEHVRRDRSDTGWLEPVGF